MDEDGVGAPSLDGEELPSHIAEDMNRGKGRELHHFVVSHQFTPCIISPRKGRDLPCSKRGFLG